MTCGWLPTNFMNGILSYVIEQLRHSCLNRNYLLFNLFLLLLVTDLPAQENACPEVKRSGATLNRELQEIQRGISQYLQENRGWIEIQQDAGNYVINRGLAVAIGGDKNRLELIFLKDAKKQLTDTLLVPWEWIRDEPLRILNSLSNIQSGSSRQEYRLKLGSCLFSVKDNPAPVRLLRDQLLQYQQRYLANWSGLDSFAYKYCMYKRSAKTDSLPEEQHRYMVQAQTCTRLGRYNYSILLLEKAISTSPFTAAENYLNMAILYAENNRYHSALYTLHKYLQLAEQEADKKTAQQKMAEWEIILNN